MSTIRRPIAHGVGPRWQGTYVYPFATDAGVGHRCTRLRNYFPANVQGTAQLWQGIQKRPGQVKRVILCVIARVRDFVHVTDR